MSNMVNLFNPIYYQIVNRHLMRYLVQDIELNWFPEDFQII